MLKGAAITALAGGVLARGYERSRSQDPTNDLALPAFTAPETYTRRTTGGTFNRLFVNRGIDHVGMSLPDDGDTFGAVCDGQDGDGYVTHRFLITQLSHGSGKNTEYSYYGYSPGIKANKYSKCDIGVRQSGSGDEISTCGSTRFVLNNRIVSSFELTPELMNDLVPSTDSAYQQGARNGIEQAKSIAMKLKVTSSWLSQKAY